MTYQTFLDIAKVHLFCYFFILSGYIDTFYPEKGIPYFFKKDISNEALPCAHRIDDEIRPVVSNIRPQKHHQSGRALR
ncbi:MAG: hypothetical protein DRI24_17780 [Deltaproteobacteria bacterium]|nr:MAG: hypothetical protein DRI24_17780 [Deltaproteobacteria bacterium]